MSVREDVLGRRRLNVLLWRRYVIEDWEQVLLQESLRGFAEAYVREGLLDINDLSPDEVHETVTRRLLDDLEEGDDEEPLGWRISFEESLAEAARRFDQEGKAELAVVMYATWFEHWLNAMLLWKMARRGLPDTDARDVIRSASLHSKTGSLWTLLFESGLPAPAVTTIRAVASRRNEFVHYKWAPAETFAAGRQDQCGQAEIAMAACLELEDQLVFGGRRAFLAQAMTLRPDGRAELK